LEATTPPRPAEPHGLPRGFGVTPLPGGRLALFVLGLGCGDDFIEPAFRPLADYDRRNVIGRVLIHVEPASVSADDSQHLNAAAIIGARQSRKTYLAMLEPHWWLRKLDRKRMSRTCVVRASPSFSYRVLVIANHLSDAAKRKPFDEVPL